MTKKSFAHLQIKAKNRTSTLGLVNSTHVRIHALMIGERAFGSMLFKELQYPRISSWCQAAGIAHCSAISKPVWVIQMFSKLLLYYCNKSFNSTLLIRILFKLWLLVSADTLRVARTRSNPGVFYINYRIIFF